MKKCPTCKISLNQVLLETNLPGYRCPDCTGIWISSNEFLAWLPPQEPSSITEITIDGDLPLPVVDNREALLCPDCDRFLRRFKIWPDLQFHLDRCSHCQGIWFDRNEWETLKLKNLHRQVHLFFTDVWQQKLRNEVMRRRLAKMYSDKWGAETYQIIKDMRAWLNQHPQRDSLLAYLTDKDPYRG